MNSRIFSGEVVHHRLGPVEHRFTYPAYFYALDLDELPALDREVRGFGYNRASVASIRDRDYLDPGWESIRDKLHVRLRAAGLDEAVGRVVLVTSARYLGHVFNPVSFYLCHGQDGELRAVVAEVNNTFGDRHLYLLSDVQRGSEGGAWLAQADKEFFVSPFFDVSGRYRFAISDEGGRMNLSVNLEREGGMVLRARLAGKGVPLTTRTLWRTLLRFPFSVLLVLPRIHWQAAKLYFRKKLPIHRRPQPRSAMTIIHRRPSLLERFAQRTVLALFARLRRHRLRVRLPDGSVQVYGEESPERTVELRVNRPRFFTRVLFGADIGFGEAYTAGDFDCDDLTGLLEVAIENREALVDRPGVLSALGRGLDYVRHRLRRNTRRTARRNIHDHYDLSNAFFSTFLDETMTYSAAVFDRADEPLRDAQLRKIDRLLDMARVDASHHLLEIGTGWGALAIRAAATRGCRVTTVTVSEEQCRLARERVAAAGLEDRVEVRLADYRDVQGRYDRIVSVEMLEAVGAEYLEGFFARISELLEPDGLAAFQVITIPDARYRAYTRSSDWIRKHIFPGGHLPSLGAINRAAARGSSLHVEHLENIGPHYGLTLRRWREAFAAAAPQVEALGFDAAFRRKWDYYLAYCEAAFNTRTLNTLQFVLTRAANPSLPRFGDARALEIPLTCAEPKG